MAYQDDIIAELRSTNAELLQRISELELQLAKAMKNSSNSSKSPLSRGYLSKLCNGVILNSLSGAHEELKRAIPEQPQLGSDETSFKNNGKKHWIWCITAGLFTLFRIASSRSRSVLEALVGEDFKGLIHFDYFSANCSFAWPITALLAT